MDQMKYLESTGAMRALSGDAATSVANSIRDQILSGVLTAGEQIKQQQLAVELGVSHIPVREAFKILESEGFVVLHPRRGAFVAELTVDNAKETWELRSVLEPMAVQHSVPCVTDLHLKRAEGLMKQAAEAVDHVAWMRLNWAFHRELYSAAQRPMLLEMINSLWNTVDRYCTVLTRANGRKHVLCDHPELLTAYKRGDSSAAVELVTAHMRAIEKKVLNILLQEDGQT
jgi:DNA-binding GntR family transcriptional regulator